MQLTKRDAFVWSNEVQIAFNKLKDVMCIYPYLTIPNFFIPFIVEYDAPKLGIRAMLMHKG